MTKKEIGIENFCLLKKIERKNKNLILFFSYSESGIFFFHLKYHHIKNISNISNKIKNSMITYKSRITNRNLYH
jgi:hypothetical protein